MSRDAAKKAVPVAATAKPAAKKPARRWRPYQLAADAALKLYGIFILLWRRQTGKTEVLSTWALQTMLEKPGETVILASASLNVGGEVALRAAGIFWMVLSRMFSAPLERLPGCSPRSLSSMMSGPAIPSDLTTTCSRWPQMRPPSQAALISPSIAASAQAARWNSSKLAPIMPPTVVSLPGRVIGLHIPASRFGSCLFSRAGTARPLL
jgi:hypothetical protein